MESDIASISSKYNIPCDECSNWVLIIYLKILKNKEIALDKHEVNIFTDYFLLIFKLGKGKVRQLNFENNQSVTGYLSLERGDCYSYSL